MNKIFRLLWIAPMLLLVSACSTGNHLTSINQKGNQAFASDNFQSALSAYDESIAAYENRGKQKECPVYCKAGQAALSLGQTDKALDYFDKARYTASENAETYIGLATCYRKIDNLSKEMDALQTYLEKYPEGKEKQKVSDRLFAIYTESENWEKAVALWPSVKAHADANRRLLEDYLIVNEALDKTKSCDSTANVLLRFDNRNKIALAWKGKKYYQLAENRYQKEMKAYETHKTRKQYAHLLKAFKKVTADFKLSLKYFKSLYRLDPKPINARYLANIYKRLDDKAKAQYYRKKAKK